MQIERDTSGRLQSHPHPHNFVDSSKQFPNGAFFMGLQRKKGEVIQSGQRFDLRGAVDKFRHQIFSYLFWKPGVEISVNHIHRKKIPPYVFSEGYIKSQHPRIISQLLADETFQESGVEFVLGLAERRQKRKLDLAGLEVKEKRLERRQSFGSQMQSSDSSELICSRSGYTLKDHLLILSETKKERDAVIGSSLLNIGMTA